APAPSRPQSVDAHRADEESAEPLVDDFEPSSLHDSEHLSSSPVRLASRPRIRPQTISVSRRNRRTLSPTSASTGFRPLRLIAVSSGSGGSRAANWLSTRLAGMKCPLRAEILLRAVS